MLIVPMAVAQYQLAPLETSAFQLAVVCHGDVSLDTTCGSSWPSPGPFDCACSAVWRGVSRETSPWHGCAAVGTDAIRSCVSRDSETAKLPIREVRNGWLVITKRSERDSMTMDTVPCKYGHCSMENGWQGRTSNHPPDGMVSIIRGMVSAIFRKHVRLIAESRPANLGIAFTSPRNNQPVGPLVQLAALLCIVSVGSI